MVVILPYSTEFISSGGAITSTFFNIDPYTLRRKCSPKNLVLAIYHLHCAPCGDILRSFWEGIRQS